MTDSTASEEVKYVLTPGVALQVGDGSGVTVRTATGPVAVRGGTAELARRLLVATEEPRTVEELARELETPASKVERLLAHLSRDGLVTTLTDLESGAGADRAADAALHLFPGSGLSGAAPSTATAEIVCEGDEHLLARFGALVSESIDVRLSERTTRAAAEGAAPGEPAPSLVVLLTRERDDARLRDLDNWARRAGVPYLAGWFEAVTAVLTHVVVPMRTACYACLRERERAAAPESIASATDAFTHQPVAAAPAGRLAASDGLLASMAALRAINVFDGVPNEAPAPTLLELNCATLRLARHPVLRAPMCVSCGSGV